MMQQYLNTKEQYKYEICAYCLMTNHVHIFAALELENCGSQELDKDEYVNVLKMPENEVLAKLGTKEFQHALMGCAMAMYLRYKLKEQQF